jgi:hypothetical protein
MDEHYLNVHTDPDLSHGTLIDVSKPPLYTSKTIFKEP